MILAEITRQFIVDSSLRVRARAAPGPGVVQAGEGPTARLSVMLLSDSIGGVFVVREVGEAPLHDVQTLLLLTDSKVDLASAVKRTVMEERKQFLKILNEL